MLLAVMAGSMFACKVFGQSRTFTIFPGRSVTIHSNLIGAAKAYQWYRNDEPIRGAIDAVYTIREAGMYKVQAFNIASCPSPFSETVEVKMARPLADISVAKVSDSKQVHMGDPFEYLLTVKNNGPLQATNIMLRDSLPGDMEYVSISSTSSGIADYDDRTKILSWSLSKIDSGSTASLRLLVKALKSGAVTNSAIVNAAEDDPVLINNKASDTKQILGISISNVFTPNGDGKNETFEIPEILTSSENEIQIVNRWGNSIYQKVNYHNEWTGEGLNEGTYFYVLKVKGKTGNWDIYKGYVTLLREKQ